jgi:hypothetical protein
MVKESLFIKFRSQWSVSFEQEINTSLSSLWKIISMPGHLEKFHPYCKKNKALKWPGPDSQDLLTYQNGKIYKREVVEWNVKDSFSLVIGEIDGPKSFVKWEFKDTKKNTKVKITVYPHLLINWPNFFSYLPYKCYITPQLRRYLRVVLSGLKHHAEKDEIKEENMIAKHPWFS